MRRQSQALILEEEEEAPLNAKRDRFLAQALKVLDGFAEAAPSSPSRSSPSLWIS
jgi:hypothetical protein